MEIQDWKQERVCHIRFVIWYHEDQCGKFGSIISSVASVHSAKGPLNCDKGKRT